MSCSSVHLYSMMMIKKKSYKLRKKAKSGAVAAH